MKGGSSAATRAKDLPRFDVDALRERAGEKVFERGQAYYRDGEVRILALERGRVLARVAGTENYRTEVTGRGRAIGGQCSCRAFADWGFCKHMVATALAANAVGDDRDNDDVGALTRIRAHLKKQGVDALVEMIVDMAERDLALFNRLEMAAALVAADDKTLEPRLRKAIDAATRTAAFVDYREAEGWAAGVDLVLDTLADLASSARAGLALKLAERAIDRVERAIGHIDDSDGYCGALLERARDIHLAAARSARPEPVQLARDLFAREMGDSYGTFGGAAPLYAEVLGKQGLREYRRLAADEWEKLAPRVGEIRKGDEAPQNYDNLRTILDFFAERDGDVDARIALRAKDLSSPWRYLELAEFCVAQGRDGEALRRAEEGLWMFEDDGPDERLVLFAAQLLSKSGRKADAEAHLWRAFEQAPSLELYARLRKIGGAPARERAIKSLEMRIVQGEPTGWGYPADFLIQILIREKMFQEAWSFTREHRASPGVKEALARASETTHPREALAVYGDRVDQLAKSGGNSAYAEAVKLITRMSALQDAASQTAYVAALKERHGRKRNFMKLLG